MKVRKVMIITRRKKIENMSGWELIKLYGRMWGWYAAAWRPGLSARQAWFKVLWRLWKSPDPDHFRLIGDTVAILESLSPPGKRKVWPGARGLIYSRIHTN